MAREDGFFDDLARGLADGSITRGKALKLMGAALVGGTLASLGLGGVAAAAPHCKPNGHHCTSHTHCCSGNCTNRVCQAGCPSGTTACGNGCVTNCTNGQLLNTTTCQCEAATCTYGQSCQGDSSCVCLYDLNNQLTCAQGNGAMGLITCSQGQSCNTNADCGAGGFCMDDRHGGFLCIARCGSNC
jgi:hypothetical protein